MAHCTGRSTSESHGTSFIKTLYMPRLQCGLARRKACLNAMRKMSPSALSKSAPQRVRERISTL